MQGTLFLPADCPSKLVVQLQTKWQEFVQRYPEAVARLQAANVMQLMSKAWVSSDFLIEQCLQDGTWVAATILDDEWQTVIKQTVLEKKLQTLIPTRPVTQLEMQKILRQFRTRFMFVLIWRLCQGMADLTEIGLSMTFLAELCIAQAVQFATENAVRQYGQPYSREGENMNLCVLALGKLGGKELNLSSDVDLIFSFSTEGFFDSEQSISYGEFFTRIGRQVIALLNEQTAQGFVFRVDMRLRPYGDAGSIVSSFNALERYYQNQGREWERYALLKARVITGSEREKKQLQQLITSFVYRKYVDYSVLGALREMKALIEREIAVKNISGNIKIGAGGIREIEFVAQALQLIYGGRKPVLREATLQHALLALQQEQLLSRQDHQLLRENYIFLRDVEHALQAYADKQTHLLPKDNLQQYRIAKLMNYEHWQQFMTVLEERRQQVELAFQNLVALPAEPYKDKSIEQEQLLVFWQGHIAEEEGLNILSKLGFQKMAAEVYAAIDSFCRYWSHHKLSPNARKRLAKLLPLLWLKARKSRDPANLIIRVHTILYAICKRSAYLVMLIENPGALEHLLTLCAASPWFSERIAALPVLLDEFLDAETLYAAYSKISLENEIQQLLESYEEDDLEAQMDGLRILRQVQILRIAAADITEQLPLMKVSDRLTELAEVMLHITIKLAMRHICKQPQWQGIEQHFAEIPFAVLAYGKLAGYEMGYGSDLDLVFLYDAEDTAVLRADELFEFCLRLSQRVMHLLSTQTAYGVLYSVDTRLRPEGGAGMLIQSISNFFHYQDQQAWTWEHQALVRSRIVYGNEKIKQIFTLARNTILSKQPAEKELALAIKTMRARILANQQSESDAFHLKLDRGGITDIEFIVQYLVLRWAKQYPRLLIWPDNIRIIEILIGEQLLPQTVGEELIACYIALRNRAHHLALQNLQPVVTVTEFQAEKRAVTKLWQQYFL